MLTIDDRLKVSDRVPFTNATSKPSGKYLMEDLL